MTIIRKRNIQKQIRLTDEESVMLKTKASAIGISESELLRALLMGYQPRKKPDDRFYSYQHELSAIGNNLNQLAAKANSLGYIDAPMLNREVACWRIFRAEIQEKFLQPEGKKFTSPKSRQKTAAAGERKRHITKHIFLSEEEAIALKVKAESVGLSESTLLRALLEGALPREKPDERFYAYMKELRAIGNNLNQLRAKANALGYVNASMLTQEAKCWSEFRMTIMDKFLLPEKETIKWE